jgi:ABC-type lipoprotein release transport system permease subunit
VVAVNEAFAQKFFPGESPIGRRINAGNATSSNNATIVAVVGGVKHTSLSEPPPVEIYVPFEQNLIFATGLIVRTTTEPRAMAAAIQRRIWSLNPDVPVTNIRSMDELFSSSVERPRVILGGLSLFAVVGLMLAAVGIYGVVAFGVQQRLRELGIRAALGAGNAALRSLVVRGGVRFALLGVAVGVPVALLLSRVMRGLVFGVSAAEPLSFLLVPAVLVLVAAAASWVPARRAAKSDPMTILREE